MLPETRYSLIARLARPEDTATWYEFVRTYETAILRFCRVRGLQQADAAEVAQAVFLAVHSVAAEWEPSNQTGSFRAWLFETARRCCLNTFRQRQLPYARLQVDAVAGDVPDLLTQLANVETEHWQQWAFCAAASVVQNEVEESTWRAFWLTAVENVPAAQVATRLQLSIGNVYTAKCRVLGRLRKCANELSVSDQLKVTPEAFNSIMVREKNDSDL